MRISDWSSDVCSSDLGKREKADIEKDMRHIGGQGLPAEAIGVVDRSRHDQPPDRPQDREHEHQEADFGMNPKRLELFAARGNAAHVPAPEKLEQDQDRKSTRLNSSH